MPSACSRFYGGILIVLCNPSEAQYLCTSSFLFFFYIASWESARDGDTEEMRFLKVHIIGSHCT